MTITLLQLFKRHLQANLEVLKPFDNKFMVNRQTPYPLGAELVSWGNIFQQQGNQTLL
jgi:hypothetical protein